MNIFNIFTNEILLLYSYTQFDTNPTYLLAPTYHIDFTNPAFHDNLSGAGAHDGDGPVPNLHWQLQRHLDRNQSGKFSAIFASFFPTSSLMHAHGSRTRRAIIFIIIIVITTIIITTSSTRRVRRWSPRMCTGSLSWAQRSPHPPSFHTPFTLFLHCFHTVFTLLLYCCCTVVTRLSHCCYTVMGSAVSSLTLYI
jgi:hypothetical protein